MSTGDSPSAPFLRLPTEVVSQIFSYLDIINLVAASQTCRTLNRLGNDDQFWQEFVNRGLQPPLTSSAPFSTFRELYIAHNPHWFLPKHRIWFSDSYPAGKLLVSKFDQESGSIVAHQVVATRGVHTVSRWERKPAVLIHGFHPRVGVDQNQPVVKLDVNSERNGAEASTRKSPNPTRDRQPLYQQETRMNTFNENRVFSAVMLCRALPSDAITEQTGVWPPLIFPAEARTRNETSDNFSSTGHRPSRLREVNDCAFRLRSWAEYYSMNSARRTAPTPRSTSFRDMAFSFGLQLDSDGQLGPPTRSSAGTRIMMQENFTTFGTISKSAYTPTTEKPYQGIWVGDYSGHGCEFVLITQPDAANARPLPEGLGWLLNWFQGGSRTRRRSSTDSEHDSDAATQEDWNFVEAAYAQIAHLGRLEGWAHPQAPANMQVTTDPQLFDDVHLTDLPDVPTGRLEAIKLTGDPNVPAGQYTFIAPDIGHTGFVRIADEEVFRGARIVRSAGHLAARGFMADQYTPSQLILISSDLLAQFWEGSGHISYYRRVDLDGLL